MCEFVISCPCKRPITVEFGRMQCTTVLSCGSSILLQVKYYLRDNAYCVSSLICNDMTLKEL